MDTPLVEGVDWRGVRVQYRSFPEDLLCQVSTHGDCAEPPPVPGPETACRVLTWNVWEDESDECAKHTSCQRRMELVGETIAVLNPDIVLLQEVTPKLWSHLRIHVPHYYSSSVDHIPTALNCPSGLQILSRWPFQANILFLPSNNGRNFLFTLINNVLFGTFHLESSECDHEIREKQVAVISQACTATGAARVVLAGDTNMKTGRTADRPLHFPGLNLVDTWITYQGSAPSLSCAAAPAPGVSILPASSGHTESASTPSSASSTAGIVFTEPGATRGPASSPLNLPPSWGTDSFRQDVVHASVHVRVTDATLVGRGPPWPSDHLGVAVTLQQLWPA